MYAHCAAVWMRASLQIHQLCAANGIRYFHFLQPNQYVAGSKPMSDSEREAVMTDHPGRPSVEQGYPLLIRAGRELSAQGVRVHDLTRLFENHPEWTYRDDCCHLNRDGHEILAREIGRIIRE